MSSNSVKGENINEHLPVFHYQTLDPILDVSLFRICELSSIVAATSSALILFEDSALEGYKVEYGFSLNSIQFANFLKGQTLAGRNLVTCEDVEILSLTAEVSSVFSSNHIRSFAGLPLLNKRGVWIGGLFVFGSESISLGEKYGKALQLLGDEAVIVMQERKMIAEFSNVEKLFNLSNDLICIAGADGYFKKISPSFTHLLGWDEETLLSRSFFELIHPEDIDKSRKEIEKLAHEVPSIEFSHRFRCQDGSYKTLEWKASLEPTSGNTYSIARDITDSKVKELQLATSEGRLRAFFDNSQGLMCTHDLKGVFLSVNEAGAQKLGYTSEQLIGKSLFDIVPQERHPLVDEYLFVVQTNGKASGQMITRHKDGSLLIWMFSNVIESDPCGQGNYVIGNGVDISMRVKLEEELSQARVMLEETGKMARVGGWNLDLKANQLSWTSMTKIIHEVPEDFQPDLSTGIKFYKEGESRNKVTAAIELGMRTGEGWDLEVQLITYKGNEVWVRAIAKMEFEGEKCIRVVGTFQDIDKSKRVQIELEQARKELNNVFNASSEISIISTDLSGIITVFNTGAEKMLGYTADEMVGKHNPECIHDPEEIKTHLIALKKEFGEAIGIEDVFTAKAERMGKEQRDWTYIMKDGTKKIVSLVVTQIRDLDNKIIGHLGFATDMTEMRQMEAELFKEKSRLSEFVQHTPAAVAMIDNSMRYIAVSNRYVEDYHLEGTELIGKSHYDFFPFLDAERKERHQRVLDGAIERREEEPITLPGFAEKQYVTWEMRPWYRTDADIGGMMLFTKNITSNVKQREELKKAKLQAEDASVAKSEFLASMSHEIRTPLNGVIGFTDLVLKTSLNETQHQYLSIVNQSANALLSIINDILDFSKIEAGRLELDIDKCDLYDMSAQATDIIIFQIQNKGLEMLLNVATDLPRFVYADSIRLKQILVNLLGNASKFTEKGEIELKIETLEADGKNHKIRFAVRDTGIGIKPEKQSKIFEAFSQEDSSTTKKYGGTGLGLTISNSLLRLMDSRLQVISEPGSGSTFFFDVTLKTERGEAIEWSDVEKIKKVLVVDDNANNRLIIRQMLLLKNIDLVEASNGFEALQVLSTGKHFDLILMDYHMPFMDGLETIHKIRETFPSWGKDEPIMLLHSSSDDYKIIESCKKLRVNHRLIKPIKIQEFYQSLSRLYKVPSVKKTPLLPEKIEVSVKDFTVLLAEDNLVNMLLARTIIKKIAPNAIVIEASNGLQTLEYCQKKLPDIILMDVQMPVMNGYESTKKIRLLEKGTRVPIIAFTAGNVKGEREKCFDAGMDDFVVKPVVEQTVEVILKKWIGSNSFPVNENKESESAGVNIHYDSARLRDYTDNDPEVLGVILKIVKSELRSSLETLNQLIQEEELTLIKQAGHKLYGTSISSGMSTLSNLARELEHLTIFHSDSINLLYKQVEEEIYLILGMMEEVVS
jgi:PAS domain S-box-containing protein